VPVNMAHARGALADRTPRDGSSASWIGVSPAGPEPALATGLVGERGALVAEVLDDTPAARRRPPAGRHHHQGGRPSGEMAPVALQRAILDHQRETRSS